jgi:hypothetical protein
MISETVSSGRESKGDLGGEGFEGEEVEEGSFVGTTGVVEGQLDDEKRIKAIGRTSRLSRSLPDLPSLLASRSISRSGTGRSESVGTGSESLGVQRM